MSNYEQFIADAHCLAQNSSHLNSKAKQRLLDASNALWYSLMNGHDNLHSSIPTAPTQQTDSQLLSVDSEGLGISTAPHVLDYDLQYRVANQSYDLLGSNSISQPIQDPQSPFEPNRGHDLLSRDTVYSSFHEQTTEKTEGLANLATLSSDILTASEDRNVGMMNHCTKDSLSYHGKIIGLEDAACPSLPTPDSIMSLAYSSNRPAASGFDDPMQGDQFSNGEADSCAPNASLSNSTGDAMYYSTELSPEWRVLPSLDGSAAETARSPLNPTSTAEIVQESTSEFDNLFSEEAISFMLKENAQCLPHSGPEEYDLEGQATPNSNAVTSVAALTSSEFDLPHGPQKYSNPDLAYLCSAEGIVAPNIGMSVNEGKFLPYHSFSSALDNSQPCGFPGRLVQEARALDGHHLLLKSITGIPSDTLRQPQKHLMPDPMLSSQTTSIITRKRKSSRSKHGLPADRRLKVAETRLRGACILCKRDKKGCLMSAGICLRCADIVGSQCARHICLGGLQAHRSKISDMFDTAFRIESVHETLPTSYGPIESLKLRHPFQVVGQEIFAHTGCLEVKVRQCLSGGLIGSISSTFSHSERVPSSNRSHTIRALGKESMAEYAIIPTSLPTVGSLDAWARGALAAKSKVSNEDLEGTMDVFLQEYCNVSPAMPLHDEADFVLRIISLSMFFDRRRPVIWPFEMRQQHQSLNAPESPLINALMDRVSFPHVSISQIAESQLYSLAAEGIIEAESKLLERLDTLMKRCDPRNSMEDSRSSLVLGLFLRRLSLLYKRRLQRYKRFQGSEVGLRIKKAEHMYIGCVTAFTTVYRKNRSPYSANWRLEEHSEAFGNNTELMALFQRVMVAEREYCRTIQKNGEDDPVLQHLFLNPKHEERAGRSWTT